MTRHRLYFTAVLLATSAPSISAVTSPQAQEIFYRAPAGRGTQLVAAARDGSNVSSLLKSDASLYFSFDVGSRDSGVVAVSTQAGELQLLTYAKNSTGVFATTSVRTLVTGIPRAAALDLSPDGTRIAYRGGDGTKLMVYTIADGTNVEWDSGTYVWDLAWARNGASIVYIDHAASGNPTHLYEVTAPHQITDVLDKPYMDQVEVSRTQGDVLLLSYTGDDGQQSLIGTWQLPSATSAGGWVNSSLAGRAVANRGVFSCDDHYLIYGSSGHAGAQTWYTRDLPSGADLLINKVGANAEPQSWSSCAAVSPANDPLQFRIPQ